ncbi:MAG: ferritin-like domain-containing protein [Actinomycetota bacterium]|nr:ferritin-like domain-containing protein [Actinomycetota bacterium]
MIKHNRLDISNSELQSAVDDLKDRHFDEALPNMKAAIASWVEENRDEEVLSKRFERSMDRRKFLFGIGGTVLGGAALAACGSGAAASSTSTTVAATTSTTSAAQMQLSSDLKIAGVAASLENLGVYAYNAGITAAQAGKLGTVPPAVVTFAQTAMAQHKDHAAAWNAVLTGAGKPAITATDATLTPTVNSLFAKVTDVTGLANLALQIEDIAAATYLSAISQLYSDKAVAAAATIQPVEMQHAAILNYVLGQYPVPQAFATITNAAKG